MRELLPNPMLASFVQFGGITTPTWVFITQLDSLQHQGSFHHKPYVIHHLVFLNPYHHQQLQLQVLEILGWLPRHVDLFSSIL
jgi:hypothetical protein